MRCRKAHKLISLAVDGELDARRGARLERHLQGCEECRSMFADLRELVAAAPALRGPEPSDAVWRKIRAGLTVPERRPATGRLWSAPALRYAGVAALAVVVTGVLVGRRPGSTGTPGGAADRQKYTLAKLDEAESHYQLAIQALGEAFAAQRGTLAPQVAEMFERNLAVVDATIQACRQAVLEEPEDLQARSFLLAAYMNKVTLLDSALDLQKRGSEAAGPVKIL